MKIIINGEIKVITLRSNNLSLYELLQDLNYNPKLVVVEYNGCIISPQEWEKHIIEDGDKIEIVTIVGGGS